MGNDLRDYITYLSAGASTLLADITLSDIAALVAILVGLTRLYEFLAPRVSTSTSKTKEQD